MTDLDKEIEEKIYDILKKYHKDEDYNLNYLITDDIVTFFLSINEGNLVTMEDLYKISGILNAKIKDMVLVNQEYRFSTGDSEKSVHELLDKDVSKQTQINPIPFIIVLIIVFAVLIFGYYRYKKNE